MTGKSIKSRVTLQHIAKAMGLHHTTISLALHNSPKLRTETRLKIQETARQMGYSPDPMLSALSLYRKSQNSPHYQATIAWINNWPNRDGLFANFAFRQYYEGASSRAQQLGYALEEFWLHEKGMSLSRLHSIWKARNIEGLLLAPQPHPRMNPSIDYSNVSAVAFGYSIQPSVLNVVTNHHFHSISLMLSKLLELGYRRIGLYVPAIWDEKVENAWLGGLTLAYKKYPELIQIPPGQDETVRGEILGKWMHKYKPDVVVSYDAMKEHIESLGYSIPKDIGFASLAVDPDNMLISGINENDFYIGQKAMDMLVGLLHRGERGVPLIPTRLLIESTWVPGSTLREQSDCKV
jgi:LacI family transcriptional regulator